MELLPWIDKNKLDWNHLSNNPNAIAFLRANFNKINWVWLSANPAAIEFLKENPQRIDWIYLSKNPAAMDLLKGNPDKINNEFLSQNPAALEYLKLNKNRIEWESLYDNPTIVSFREINPDILYNPYISPSFENLKNNFHKINWDIFLENLKENTIKKEDFEKKFWSKFVNNGLLPQNINYIRHWISFSPLAVEFLEKHPEIINWWNLSKNPAAMKLLKANRKEINWEILSSNIGAMKLLEENQEYIDWPIFSENPAIFTYKYSFITLICAGILGLVRESQSDWYLFLWEGLYDPRLLIFINEFLKNKYD